jgi:hypothetical protein
MAVVHRQCLCHWRGSALGSLLMQFVQLRRLPHARGTFACRAKRKPAPRPLGPRWGRWLPMQISGAAIVTELALL